MQRSASELVPCNLKIVADRMQVPKDTPRTISKSPFLKGILNFTPSWFSVIMGTGIISLLLVTEQHKFRGMWAIGVAFYILNIVLFTVFALVTAARFIVFPWSFFIMLHHPTPSMFIGTIPISFATIVNATAIIAAPRLGEWAVNFVWGMWWLDVALTVLSSFCMPVVMFHYQRLSLDQMTATWLLPIVPCVVTAASGGVVAPILPESHALITILVSYVLWSIGMSLSFIILALYFQRLCVYKLPTVEIIVSALLPLGLCGQGAFGIISLAGAGKGALGKHFEHVFGISGAGGIIFVISVLVGLMIWGLGLWWLIHGVSSILIRMLPGRSKFNIGYWGFLFPIGAWISGTLALAQALSSPFLSYLSLVLLAVLIVLYVYVVLGTFHGLYMGTILVAPCLTNLTADSAAKGSDLQLANLSEE